MTRASRAQPYDVALVGGGLAGLTAALTAAGEGARVVVLSKGPLLASTSYFAQGGVAAAVGMDDDAELHVRDTLEAGRGLCRESAVRVLAEDAPARVADLQAHGVRFDDGLGLEGGHSRRRVLHVDGAETGRWISEKLAERVLAHPAIDVVEGERVVELVPGAGVVTERGEVAARAVVVATGGYAALWARTTNPPGTVGEGIAMAFRARAAVADLEFVQFHPTALAPTGFLLSEALRGEGALLLDDEGRRFTNELAPRDVVARAVAAQGTALLDLRPVDRSRFPSLMAKVAEAGFDPAVEPVPIAPAAHYTMGGIVTDLDGRTNVPGLYAAGECACTGVHGANRLASNSMLECLVFGRRAALAALFDTGDFSATSHRPKRLGSDPTAFGQGETFTASSHRPKGLGSDPRSWPTRPWPNRVGSDPTAFGQGEVTEEARRDLWESAGLIRDAAGLERLHTSPVLLARLVAESALARRESRGGHFRVDFPHEDRALDGMHTVVRPGRKPVLERWT